MINNLSLC